MKHAKRNLYHRLNVVPQKKVMTFNRHVDNFKFYVSYNDLDFMTEERVRYIEYKVSPWEKLNLSMSICQLSGQCRPESFTSATRTGSLILYSYPIVSSNSLDFLTLSLSLSLSFLHFLSFTFSLLISFFPDLFFSLYSFPFSSPYSLHSYTIISHHTI